MPVAETITLSWPESDIGLLDGFARSGYERPLPIGAAGIGGELDELETRANWLV